MSWSLFIDEPVDSRGDCPYKVVAGLAIEDKQIWPLTLRLSDANLHYFGCQLRAPNSAYVKAEELLSRNIFDEAKKPLNASSADRLRLVSNALSNSGSIGESQIALSQAKLIYCRLLINFLREYKVRAFAIMAPAAVEIIPVTNQLRRDYTFLFERFFYFLEDQTPLSFGNLILSDLNKYTVSANTVSDYFLKTTKGKLRSKLIIPEPFYARGRLNILFQATSLLAYSLSWGFRTPTMHEAVRPELAEVAATFRSMRYLHTSRDGKKDWSFKFIADLWSA